MLGTFNMTKSESLVEALCAVVFVQDSQAERQPKFAGFIHQISNHFGSNAIILKLGCYLNFRKPEVVAALI